jgi:hypothetical protein
MAADQVTTTATRRRAPPPVVAVPDLAEARFRAIMSPHWHLTEEEAAGLLAGLSRAELLHVADSATRLARTRDGLTGHELPNRNALLIAAQALLLLLFGGPRLAMEGGAA